MFRQVPLVTRPQVFLGETFEEDLKSRLAPLEERLRAGVMSLVDQKIIEEAKKAVIKAGLIGGGVGLVIGVLIAPAVRDLLGIKK